MFPTAVSFLPIHTKYSFHIGTSKTFTKKRKKERKKNLSSLYYMPKSLHNRHSAGPISKAQLQIKKNKICKVIQKISILETIMIKENSQYMLSW